MDVSKGEDKSLSCEPILIFKSYRSYVSWKAAITLQYKSNDSLIIKFPAFQLGDFLFSGCFSFLYFMFHIISNYKLRDIIADISVDDFVELMRKPDFARKAQVDMARYYGKGTEKYSKIKEILPCVVFNFSHSESIRVSTLQKPTGYLYIDFDGCGKFDFSEFDFISCAWYSLSNTGLGILIKCEGLDSNRLREQIEEVSSILGVPSDSKAISKDRCNVLGYDNDIYYNSKCSTYKFLNNSKITKSSSSSSTNTPLIRLQPNELFSDTKIRFSNYSELISKIDFNGEPFIDLGDDKLQYAEVIVPSRVLAGGRNQTMFAITTQVFGLNLWMTRDRLFNSVDIINNDKFHPVIKKDELNRIVDKVFEKKEPVLILNRTKRIIFNPDYTLTGKERRTMSSIHIGAERSKKTTESLLRIVESWDFEKLGKITQEKIALEASVGLATVKRRMKGLLEIIKIINIENLRNKK